MVILLLLWRAEGYHQSAVGHLSPFIHECRTYYLNSRITEGAGALASAALLSGKLKHYVEGKKTVSIISGGNIDLTRIAEIIEQNNIRQFSL
ncbi:hypothetical protein ACEUA0_20095 [Aeromonas veronii]